MSNVFSSVVTLGKDSVVREAGKSNVLSFSGASNVGFGDREQTLWLDCSVWGARATEKMQSALTKGTRVFVSGELGTREYEGKTYMTLNVSVLDFVGQKSDSSQPSKPASNEEAPESDVPF